MMKINIHRPVIKNWLKAYSPGASEADEEEIEQRVDTMVEFAAFVIKKVSQQMEVKHKDFDPNLDDIDFDLEFDPD